MIRLLVFEPLEPVVLAEETQSDRDLEVLLLHHPELSGSDHTVLGPSPPAELYPHVLSHWYP